MKILAPLALAIPLTSCGTLSGSVDWVDYGEDPMQNPQYMQDAMAAGAPGPQHAALARRAGSWSVEGRTWMAPGTEPMPMTATATTEVLLGGRYVIEEFESDFMGMPFEGRLISGYDNVTGQYWSFWCDNVSTGAFLTRGQETAPGHVELHGTATDILTPDGRPTRMTNTANDDGTHTMRMYDSRAGSGEFLVMELHYTRR